MMKTNCIESIFSEPADLGSPTDSEINALAESATDIERSRLMQASLALYIAKMRIGNRTPWRELVSEFRSSEPVRVEVSVVFQDGVEGIQTVVMDRGFGLQGDAQLMFSALEELNKALEEIEYFDPARHVNKAVKSHVATLARTGHGNDDRKVAKSRLIKDGYLEARRGEQKKIKTKIAEDCGQSLRQMDILIAEIKEKK